MWPFKQKESKLKEVGFCPDWTHTNAAELKRFLASETGRILLQRARAMEAKHALDACSKGSPNPRTVAGITFTINWFENLARIPAPPAENEEISDSRSWQYADESLPDLATT